MTKTYSTLPAVTLLLSDARGIYIPQNFVESCLEPKEGHWTGVADWARGECAAGPDTDGYWDAWDDILNRAIYHAPNGDEFRLYQDGDLWLLCFEKMSAEERENFGFESVFSSDTSEEVEALEAFALENYEAGGHWVYETHDRADYEQVLHRAGGDLEEAKAALRQYWGLMNDRRADCAFGDGTC